MSDQTRSKSKAGGVNTGGDPVARPAKESKKTVEWRMKVPAVLDAAVTAYAEALSLGKMAAARSILMRVLVKRTMRAPDPLDHPA